MLVVIALCVIFIETKYLPMKSLTSFQPLTSDSRASTRRLLMTGVLVLLDGVSVHRGNMTDISNEGVGLIMEHLLPSNAPVKIQLIVFIDGEAQEFILPGTIVYTILKGMDGFRTGVRISKMDSALKKYISTLPSLSW